MNTYNEERLKAAAQAGDVDLLYTVIQYDPSILERIDLVPFVETPLHIAASMDHLQFATEIMMLKPSFAFKLNPQGFSPIHLAMHTNQKRMVLHFLTINKDLARVAGRDGLTLLHLASQIGGVELLAVILSLCPESILCVTSRRETALHIAIKNGQYVALQILVGWLKINTQRGAYQLENTILNHKDEAGNTILHISALNNEQQALQLLVETTSIYLNSTNWENKTALDITTDPEIKSILGSVGAKSSLQVSDAPNLTHIYRPKTVYMDKMFIQLSRMISNATEADLNTLLIIATLVATTMFESVLTPPGGVYQISAGDNNMNITTSNSTISIPKNVGKSVLPESEFIVFSVVNMVSFFISTMVIFVPLGFGNGITPLVCPLGLFMGCYLFSISAISPNTGAAQFTWMSCMISTMVFYYFSLKSRISYQLNADQLIRSWLNT